MATAVRTRGTSAPASGGAATGLRVLAIFLGVFLIFEGLGKLAWLGNSGLLGEQLQGWLKSATPGNRWYLEILMPGIPLFARLVVFGEARGGHRARHGLLDATGGVRRIPDGPQLPLRERAPLRLCVPDERLRSTRARRAAGAGDWRGQAAVERSRVGLMDASVDVVRASA